MKRLFAISIPIFLAACSSNPEPVIWEDPAMKVILSRKPAALPYSIAVAPIEIGSSESEIRTSLKKKHLIMRDFEGLRTEFVQVLEKTAGFRKIRKLPDVAAGKDFRKAMLGKAWDAGDDLVMFLRLKRYENSWEGTNGNYIPSLLMWIMFVFPSWWIADERFGAAVEIEATVVSAHSGREVASAVFSASEIRDLDDFDRGWSLFGILSMPSSMDEENWEKVSEVVSPYPIAKIQVDMAKYFSEEFPRKAAAADFSRNMSKTLGLFVGLSKYDSYTLHNIRYAARDAETVHGLLTGEAEGQIPPRNAMLLLNEQATGANLRKAIEEFLITRSRPDDTVILYFAGYGGFGPGKGGEEAYLMPYDYGHKAGLAGSALAFSYLRDSVEKCAGRVILMVDASFTGDSQARSFAESKSGAAQAHMAALVGSRPRAAAVFASGPGEHALEFDDSQMGLFSFYACEGMGGKADKDRDGFVTVEELVAYSSENVYKRSLLAGDSQKPVLFDGGGAAATRLAAIGRKP